MYFTDTSTAVESVHTFWLDNVELIPGDVSVQVESAGDILNDANGDLIDTWTSDPVAAVPMTGTGSYSAPSGACIDWLTATIAGKHRLRGRTFLVPIVNSAYEENGSIRVARVAEIKSRAEDLIASQSASFVVWHRGTGDDGSSGLITSAHVPSLAAVLKSRRD